ISAKLSRIATTVPAVGQNLVRPSEYFSPSAQATSSNPAARSAAQPLTTSCSQIKSVNQCAQFRDPRTARAALHVFDAWFARGFQQDAPSFSRLVSKASASSIRCSRDRHVTSLGRLRDHVNRLSQN